MTEEERKEFAEWLDSPRSEFPLALGLMKASNDGGLYFEVPETNGFPANRFAGRLMGYMYALVAERVELEQEFRINIDTIRPYASADEIAALEALVKKIDEQAEKDVPPFDDGYVGRLEGIAIFLERADSSLLYSETDIDLNRGRDAEGIPSYAYHRSHRKAGLQLAQCDKSREEVIQMLKNDGLGEKGATMITDRMIRVVKEQRKRNAIKSFFIGLTVLFIGMLVTSLSYSVASESRNGRFILMWGALGFGGYHTIAGIFKFIKAMRYKG